jgi:hypothetical protein
MFPPLKAALCALTMQRSERLPLLVRSWDTLLLPASPHLPCPVPSHPTDPLEHLHLYPQRLAARTRPVRAQDVCFCVIAVERTAATVVITFRPIILIFIWLGRATVDPALCSHSARTVAYCAFKSPALTRAETLALPTFPTSLRLRMHVKTRVPHRWEWKNIGNIRPTDEFT